VILIAPLASVAQTVTYQLRGFTSTTVLGDHGVLEMTRQCAVEFGGAGATRMCTSSEILNTATVVQGLVGEAWVRPAWQPSGNRSLDDSGHSDAFNLTCGGFSRLNQDGLTVDGTGSFGQVSCNVARPIACCHPVVVPEPTAAVGLGAGAAALAALGAGKR